ncbi:MAG: ABC transporter permease [Desulfurococcales archaeon]|nr:ABC transporter permease [Desulfurococcales archaeon]
MIGRLRINNTSSGSTRGALDKLAPLVSLSGFLLLWSMVSYLNIFPRVMLPSPVDVARAAIVEAVSGNILQSLINSLKHYSLGLLWGSSLGVTMGLIVGWYKLAEALAEPLIRIFRPIPPLAWIPFAILWMGISHAAAAFLIGLQAFWICLLNTYSGVKSTDRNLIEAVMCFGETNRLRLLKKVVLPSSLPYILSGIRISLGQGWLTVIAAELFGIPGLGQRLIEAGMNLAMNVVVVYMIVIGIMYYLIDKVYKIVEEILLAWR